MKASIIGEVMLMDNDDLNRLIEAIKSRRSILSKEVKRNFRVGDTVSFTRKNGTVIEGTVRKICRKNIQVNSGYSRWTVAPTLLTLVER